MSGGGGSGGDVVGILHLSFMVLSGVSVSLGHLLTFVLELKARVDFLISILCYLRKMTLKATPCATPTERHDCLVLDCY